jgi:CubicO group peptidase (beta-lactamase class C family)
MENKATKAVLLACLLLCGFGADPSWAVPAVDTARMEQVLQAAATDDKFMGAVLVARGDAILLDNGYGAANLEWNIPNTPQTRFRIGSLTKQFAAAATLLLEERGKLRLNDPVKTYLSDAPAGWDKITLFDLLTQTSGIPDYTDAPDFGDTMRLQRKPQQLIAAVRDKPLDFAPGEKFAYSNSNYVLLAQVIEKTSGVSFQKFVQDNIFTPLGMKDSGFDGAALMERRASPYSRRDGAIVNAAYVDASVQVGGGAICSTTHDLLTWEKALLGGKLLSPDSLKKMLTPFRDARGPGVPFKAGYGMGVYVGTTRDGHREIAHTGSSAGVITMMAAYPDEKLFVILLSNTQTTPFADIVSKLADLGLGKTIVLPSERREVPFRADIMAGYAGRYQLRPGFVIEIARNGDALVAHPGSNPAISLLPESNTSFYAKDPDLQVDFRVTNGQSASLTWHVNGDVMDAPRLP